MIRGPDYETLVALGSLRMNSDLTSIVRVNEICDRLGIDTISAGSAIAFAMESYEKGLIRKQETNGLDLAGVNSRSPAGGYRVEKRAIAPLGGVVLFNLVSEAFEAVTERTTDHWTLLKKGERIWNIKRAFNVKMGMTANGDKLPRRLLEPLPDGAAEGKIPPTDLMLRGYCELRGWIDGKPSQKT